MQRQQANKRGYTIYMSEINSSLAPSCFKYKQRPTKLNLKKKVIHTFNFLRKKKFLFGNISQEFIILKEKSKSKKKMLGFMTERCLCAYDLAHALHNNAYSRLG